MLKFWFKICGAGTEFMIDLSGTTRGWRELANEKLYNLYPLQIIIVTPNQGW
jgi:hypothetical protein